MQKISSQPGVLAALAAACLFGASTPLAKWLLGDINPWWMAALLYLGSGLGLALYQLVKGASLPRLQPGDTPWLVAAIASGGVVAPVLLMQGLQAAPASSASLLLNAEGVFTTLLAWWVFKENFDCRIALGAAAIVLGAVVLGWPAQGQVASVPLVPALCILGACLAWALDNNFTRKISLNDAAWLASIKGLSAGCVNLTLALWMGASWPQAGYVGAAMVLGFAAYGVSLALFVVGLRHLGAARTGAYFSVAPFVGAVLSIAMFNEPITARLVAAGALMAWGVWLHLTEHHAHPHSHAAMAHAHWHTHDASHDGHHDHTHLNGLNRPAGAKNAFNPALLRGGHSHVHHHEAINHQHPHTPDAHHTHSH